MWRLGYDRAAPLAKKHVRHHHLAIKGAPIWTRRQCPSCPPHLTEPRPVLPFSSPVRQRCYHASPLSLQNHGNNNTHQQLFSSFQYPLAIEAPQVSKTTARDAQEQQLRQMHKKHPPPGSSQAASTLATTAVPPDEPDSEPSENKEAEDPFDDAQTLDPAVVQQLRQEQQQQLPKTLSSPYTTAILPTVPAHIPPNVPADQLETPHTLLTTLSNGIRVVSQETYGQVSTVGVVSQVGSRFEQAARGETGATHLLEILAFGENARYGTGADVANLLQDYGGTRLVHTAREQSLHAVDMLRPHLPQAMSLLEAVLLEPAFTEKEVQQAYRTVYFQSLDIPPEVLLSEALQVAAFGSDQALGQPHWCPVPEHGFNNDAVLANADSFHGSNGLTAEVIRGYWQRRFLENPQSLVIAGAGVEHDFLAQWAERAFGHLTSPHKTITASSETPSSDAAASAATPESELLIPSIYRGGETKRQHHSADGLVRVALGLPVGGWHSGDLVATCVLQTLLGGGSSFSAGGPGKGMYSRLYRQVLNRYAWAESAEAFTSFHAECGLWGISGSTSPHRARDMVQVLAQHLARLAAEPVSEEELSRARNMLKCNVLTQLESRLVLFEDLGRQVLTYGRREDMHTTCEKIEAVNQQDIMTLAQAALQQPPSVASVGPDLSHIPHHEEISSWLLK